jgi:hypothetical protein
VGAGVAQYELVVRVLLGVHRLEVSLGVLWVYGGVELGDVDDLVVGIAPAATEGVLEELRNWRLELVSSRD